MTNADTAAGIPLSPAEQAAIGALETPGGEVRCTASLIGRRWVLAAKHCIQFGDQDALVFHTWTADGDITLPAVATFAHPSLDVMLFEIPPSTLLEPPHVVPLVPSVGSDPSNWLGRTLTLAGLGDTEQGTDGSRRFLHELVVEVNDLSIVVDGGPEHGACTGDSGGPLLDVLPDGSVRVAGLLSTGSASCRGKDRYVRTDGLADWAQTVFAQRAASPCGDVTWEGVCGGGRARWCAGDHVEAADCRNHQLCGWDVSAAGYRCVKSTDDPCLGAPASGDCDGNTLRVCAHGRLLETDCGTCGALCNWNGQSAACR